MNTAWIALQVYGKNKEQLIFFMFAKEVIPQLSKLWNAKFNPNYTKRNSLLYKKTVHDYVYIILHLENKSRITLMAMRSRTPISRPKPSINHVYETLQPKSELKENEEAYFLHIYLPW
jgi:hypothetical protein